MANISFFYPERKKGFALGLNAAGGNLGVSVAQLVVPLAIIIGVPSALVKVQPHPVHIAYAGLMWLPLIAIAVIASWLMMDSLTQAKTDTSAFKASMRHSHTWIVSLLYIGTFGSFIGFSFALPLVIKTTFPEFLADHPFIATYLAGLGFMGALVGSVSRPLGGWVSDKIGGAKVTLAVFVGMVAATAVAISGVRGHSFAVFFSSYLVHLPARRNGQRVDVQDDPVDLPGARASFGGRQGNRHRGRTARLQTPGRRRYRCDRRDRSIRWGAHPSRPSPSQPWCVDTCERGGHTGRETSNRRRSRRLVGARAGRVPRVLRGVGGR